jgi:hypothetical protein
MKKTKTIRIPHNFTPRPYQKKLYNAIHDGYRRGVAVWHRRAGKDKVLLNIMIKEMLKRVGTYYYFFPYYGQGEKAIWEGIDNDGFPFMKHFPDEIVKHSDKQKMKKTLVNGSIFQIIGTDHIDAIMSTNPVGCVFSEYALQKPEAWELVKPILRVNGGWALFNFTPRGLNHGWDIYQTAQRNDSWFVELLTINDTGALSEADIDAERAEGMSEQMIQQEYYCDFTVSSGMNLIPLEIITAAAGKVIPAMDYQHAPKIIGVDVATEHGPDACVKIKRQGLVSFDLQKYSNIDNMSYAALISQDIREWNPDAVFIDAGRGEGVIDRLTQLGHKKVVIPVNFGGRANKPARYKNKRVEMWADTGKWLESGGAIPNDPSLRQELSIPTYTFDAADRMQLPSKQKMFEDYGFSPDCADALVLTHAHPVVAKADRMRKVQSNRRKKYNPTTYMDAT